MTRKETLDAALTCVLKDRNATHGEPEDSFALISKFWSSYTGYEIQPHDVAIMMSLMKIARLKFSPDNDDNWVDVAGYAACGAEVTPMKPDNTTLIENLKKEADTMRSVIASQVFIKKPGFVNGEQFDADYYLRGPQTGKSNYENYHWMEERTIAYAKRMTKHLGATCGQSIHDIGCARGYLVKAMRMIGFIATGHDISKWAISHGDLDVADSIYRSKGIPHDVSSLRVDWYHCKDVLEHMSSYDIIDLVRHAIGHADRGMLIIVPLVGGDGEYIYPPDRRDSTHIQKMNLDGWLRFLEKSLEHLNNQITIEASYHIPGLRSASDSYPFSTGFFTIRRLISCLPSE